MPWFRIRPLRVEAVRFDGSVESAAEVVEWARSVAPEIAVRPRTEYRGWDDRVGHLELEVRHEEDQVGEGDWLVHAPGRRCLEIVSDALFRARFQSESEPAVG